MTKTTNHEALEAALKSAEERHDAALVAKQAAEDAFETAKTAASDTHRAVFEAREALRTVQVVDETKTVKVTPNSWEKERPAVELQLIPSIYSESDWTVMRDGRKIGTLHAHTTRAERPTHRGSRIVTRGAEFKAWAVTGVEPGSRATYWRKERVRAEALRDLIRADDRRIADEKKGN